MHPSDHDDDKTDTTDLERRLREAFSAKALQISDADLDREREEEVVAALSEQRRGHRATRWFAGVGAAAAAAAIVGITFVGLQDSGHPEIIDGLPPASTTSSPATASGNSPATSSSTSPTSAPQTATGKTMRPNQQSGAQPSLPQSSAATGPSTAPSSATGSTAPSSSAMSGATGPTASSSPPSRASSESMTLTARQPPMLPAGLPQASPLGDQEYVGAVPLRDPSGGSLRELSMPSGTKWERTAESGNSLTVRITDLPTDIEAYWQQTLPGQGWVRSGGGWSFPHTGYTVSAITDKGSFTVTW
ncbi:hypothetical protein [Flexivirga sp. B27]